MAVCNFKIAEDFTDEKPEKLASIAVRVCLFHASQTISYCKITLGHAVLFGLFSVVIGCSPPTNDREIEQAASPYLFIFAGDADEKDSDFLAVFDVDSKSARRGTVISTRPIGFKGSMPHHMEYSTPPKGEPLFMNAHGLELSLIIDIADPRDLSIERVIPPAPPFRFPHDYTRTPSGNRLIGFLRSDDDSSGAKERIAPGSHGGIAEYTIDGDLIRTASAADPDYEIPIRPYAFSLLPDIDRLIVTSAPMMEKYWADTVQIFRYSDFALLHTLDLPVGRDENGNPVNGSQRAGFGPRALDDGSVFLNSYGCSFFHLTEIDSDNPQLKSVFTLNTKPAQKPGRIRGACGIPLRIGKFWIQPAGSVNAVIVFDISNPATPKEVHRIRTPKSFNPHWLAKDPLGNRLVLGAELGGEQGFYILKFDPETGALEFDLDFDRSSGNGLFRKKRPGYISLAQDAWPHGHTGAAWGHAALFFGGE